MKRDFNIQTTLPAEGGSILDELTGATPAARPASPPASDQPPLARSSPPARSSPAPAPALAEPSPPPKPARVPIRVQVPARLADRVRAAVAALQYRVPEWESLNAATTAALERLVSEAEREHNHGEPFPWRQDGHLRPGRRVGHQ